MSKGKKLFLGCLAALVLVFVSVTAGFKASLRTPFVETLQTLKGLKPEKTEIFWTQQKNLATGINKTRVTRVDTFQVKRSFDEIHDQFKKELWTPMFSGNDIVVFTRDEKSANRRYTVRFYRKPENKTEVVVLEGYNQRFLENAYRVFRRSTGIGGPPKNLSTAKIPGPKGGTDVESYQLN